MPKIKELFSDKSKWTQGAHARNKYGESVSSRHVDAVCWCLVGALHYCYLNDDDGHSRAEQKILIELYARGYEGEDRSIFRFNDQAQFEDIRELVTMLDI